MKRLLACLPWTREARLRRRFRRYLASLDSDEVPAYFSPGRSTRLRPGETHLEAMNRLMEGEDL